LVGFFHVFRRFSIAAEFLTAYLCAIRGKRFPHFKNRIKMNTTKNKKNVLSVICLIALMTGGGLLLGRTLGVCFHTSSAMTVILLSLLSVFLYVAGATLAGMCTNGNRTGLPCGSVHGGSVFALLLIAAGMLLLGFNTGALPPVWRGFFFSWPMLLFVIGAVNICRFRFISGIVLAAAGMFFLFSRATEIYPYDVLYEQFVSTFWPILVIAAGVLIFLASLLKPKRFGRGRGREVHSAGADADGKINYRFVFSGTEQAILDPVFRGGTIEVIFGGMELDLRRTSLPEGDTFLRVKAVFGGVEIFVPDSWEIEIHQKSFAGGVDNARTENGGRDRDRKLILIAECTFGGIDVR
jgi:predicted membrane protein